MVLRRPLVFKKMLKYAYAPRWVNLLYALLEFLDYRIVSRISSHLMWWRNNLLDKYCHCPKCLERQRERERQAQSF